MMVRMPLENVPGRTFTIPDNPTLGDLARYLWSTAWSAKPNKRTHVKQALWHCLGVNGAGSGVTFPTERIDWVTVEKPDVDGDVPATQNGRLWHHIRSEMFSDCLTRIGNEAREAARSYWRDITTNFRVLDEKCAEAASSAVGAYLAGCPGSEFTRRVRPW